MIGQLFTYRTKVKLLVERNQQNYFKSVSLYGLKCCSSRSGKERKALDKAREEYEKEADLVEMLRTLRLFKIFLRKYSERFKGEFEIALEKERCKYRDVEVVGTSDLSDEQAERKARMRRH